MTIDIWHTLHNSPSTRKRKKKSTEFRKNYFILITLVDIDILPNALKLAHAAANE